MGHHGRMRSLALLVVVSLLLPWPAGAAGAPSKSRVTDDEPAPSADDPPRGEDEDDGDDVPGADAIPQRRRRALPAPSPARGTLPVREGTELREREAEPEPPRDKRRTEESIENDDERKRQEAIERQRQRRRKRPTERRPRRDAAPPEAPKPPPKSQAPAPSSSGCNGCCAAPCCGPSPLGCSSCGVRCVTYGLVGAGAGLLVGGSAGFLLGYVAAPESASLQERAEGGLLLGLVGGVGGAVALGLGGALVGSAMTMALGE